ncbi:MAG: nucleotidyltransferase family protein [Candidatus Omnitrophica bacterium]|nr:nucleotidyltransferase family protein [Candidatus Omnitrophota bacterium]
MGERKMAKDVLLSILRKDSAVNRDLICGRTAHFKSADWNDLLERALKYGLFPAFYEHLMKMKLDNIPRDFLLELKALYAFNLKRNILLERESLAALSFLKDAGIPSIPLKGPITARYIYGDLAFRRTSCDLDFLIKPEHFKKAAALLTDAGWISAEKGEETFSYKFALKFAGQISFTRKTDSSLGTLVLDLHKDLLELFMFASLKDFWNNAREIDLDGNKVLMPSNESLLVYFSLLSMSLNIRYIYDVGVIVSKCRDAINWRRIASSPAYSRHRTSVYFAIKNARELFACDIPEDFLKAVRPNAAKRLVLTAWINKTALIHKPLSKVYNSRVYGKIWYYFVASLLYSENLFGCVNIVIKKIFYRGFRLGMLLR